MGRKFLEFILFFLISLFAFAEFEVKVYSCGTKYVKKYSCDKYYFFAPSRYRLQDYKGDVIFELFTNQYQWVEISAK